MKVLALWRLTVYTPGMSGALPRPPVVATDQAATPYSISKHESHSQPGYTCMRLAVRRSARTFLAPAIISCCARLAVSHTHSPRGGPPGTQHGQQVLVARRETLCRCPRAPYIAHCSLAHVLRSPDSPCAPGLAPPSH